MPGVQWLDEHELRAWRQLQQMQLRLTAALTRDLSDSGLSYLDYLVLVVLTAAPEGKMRAFQLSRDLGWEKSRLSHHVSRMEERGLVKREKCSEDRRGANVVVTARGRRAIEAAAPTHVAGVRQRFVDLLTPSELAAVSEISAKVLAGLEEECSTADF